MHSSSQSVPNGSSNRQLSVASAVQWLNEQGIELSRRTAQRRVVAALERVAGGHPEPGDRQVQLIGHVYAAPASWWHSEFQKRPIQQRGRPRKPQQKQSRTATQ